MVIVGFALKIIQLILISMSNCHLWEIEGRAIHNMYIPIINTKVNLNTNQNFKITTRWANCLHGVR